MKQKSFIRNLGIVLLLANLVLLVVLFVNRNQQNEKVRHAQTELDESEQELAIAMEQFKYDRRTGLYKMQMFPEIYEDKVSNLKDGEKIAVINLSFGSDKRGLKFVNDTYGHYYGRFAIKRFVSIIEEVYNEEGAYYIDGGGSNFFVVVDDGEDREALLKKAELFKEKWCDAPFVIEGVEDIYNMALFVSMYVIDDKNIELETVINKLTKKKHSFREKDIHGIGFVN